MALDVDVSGVMNSVTMTVTIRPTRVWLLKARVLLCMFLIVLASKVVGVGRLEFVQEDERS